MYSTSLKTWARVIAIDSVLIGTLVAGVIFHVPYALEVSVFFLWWFSILGLVTGLILLAAANKTFAEQLKELPLENKTTKKIIAEISAIEDGRAKLWSTDLVNRLAASNTYLTYHWLTDIAVWVLLIIAGHPILATFKVASFLVSCMLIGVARRLYRERLGIKTDEDIQNEFAQHRAHVRQVNNVGDTSTK